MTDHIDLDEMDVEPDGEDRDQPNPGDWLWADDGGDPEDEPTPEWAADDAGADAVPGTDASPDTDGEPGGEGAGTDDEGAEGPDTARVPHVPRENEDKPVGIPVESGGAGGAGPGRGEAEEPPEDSGGHAAGGEATASAAEGPHGGGIDDMTMALTYEAATRLENPRAVAADANAWADWVGIVGDVEAYTINKFQREHGIDGDFFSGAGQGPAERLADIGPHSMFYAERMVVVGTEGEEWIAEEAGWEFVPLAEAAGKADWSLEST